MNFIKITTNYINKMPEGKGTYGSKRGRPPAKKTEEITIDGKKIKFEKGALRRALKIPANEKILMGDLKKANKTEIGKDFMYDGKKFKMTQLMKKRITFANNLYS